MVKSCLTCDHRKGDVKFGHCSAAGIYCTVERQYNNVCSKDFSTGWVQRRPFLYRLFGINK